MKKLSFFLMALIILVSGCSHKTKDFVYLGQLFNTFGHGSQEKVKGKVKEFKQTHFWAEEDNGKVIKGRVITSSDRRKTPLGRDYIEEFNESGAPLRSTTYDENGKVLLDIKSTADGKILKGADYIINDTVRTKVSYQYDGDKMTQALVRNAANDTVIMSIEYEYDGAGNILKVQTYNFRDEPLGYNLYMRDEKGYPVRVDSYNKAGKLTSLHEYTYNKSGDRIGHHEVNYISGEITDYTFAYEYDTIGNYSAIIFIKDGKPFIYRAREIKYYD